MLDQIVEYLTDSSISGSERILTFLLPVICFTTTTYLSFSYLARTLADTRKGGIFKFSLFCLVKAFAFVCLVVPWAAFLYMALDVALHP